MSGPFATGARALLMLIAANSAPWLAGRLCSGRGAVPMDFGVTLADGQRLFGSHKTWIGFASGVASAAVVGRLCGLNWWVGVGFGSVSLLGDVVSSAIKRRLRRAPGADVPIIDQLPEALLPVWLLRAQLDVSALTAAATVAAFIALDLLCTRRPRGAPAAGKY